MSYKTDIKTVKNNIYFDLDFADIIKTKEQFIILVDSLQKDDFISEKTSENIYLSMNKKTKHAFIYCGSYKERIL